MFGALQAAIGGQPVDPTTAVEIRHHAAHGHVDRRGHALTFSQGTGNDLSSQKCQKMWAGNPDKAPIAGRIFKHHRDCWWWPLPTDSGGWSTGDRQSGFLPCLRRTKPSSLAAQKAVQTYSLSVFLLQLQRIRSTDPDRGVSHHESHSKVV